MRPALSSCSVSLTSASGREVTRAVRLRHSPELRFVLDESYDRMDRTREMLGEARVRRDLEAED